MGKYCESKNDMTLVDGNRIVVGPRAFSQSRKRRFRKFSDSRVYDLFIYLFFRFLRVGFTNTFHMRAKLICTPQYRSVGRVTLWQ